MYTKIQYIIYISCRHSDRLPSVISAISSCRTADPQERFSLLVYRFTAFLQQAIFPHLQLPGHQFPAEENTFLRKKEFSMLAWRISAGRIPRFKKLLLPVIPPTMFIWLEVISYSLEKSTLICGIARQNK